MNKISKIELKAKLRIYLDKVSRGEKVVITETAGKKPSWFLFQKNAVTSVHSSMPKRPNGTEGNQQA